MIQETNPPQQFHKKSFIESDRFPVSLVSQVSAKEKRRGGGPDYWEMVFWWTRKPLASARAVIAGCLLPEETPTRDFIKALRLDKKIPHRFNPEYPEDWKHFFEDRLLLDPFAGFGSIPFEALRLGVSAYAVELLPTAYIFLKAVLEYPIKFGQKLREDVQFWGNWISDQVKNDETFRILYDAKTSATIGTWEILCPHCNRWTPMVGNYWLARVKNNKGKFERLAWFEFVEKNHELKVKIVDLSNGKKLDLAVVAGNRIKLPEETFDVPSSNVDPRAQRATCLRCGNPIRFVDRVTGKHYLEKKKLPKDIAVRLEWHVKDALKRFNQGDRTAARIRLLVNISNENGQTNFRATTTKDEEALDRAESLLNELMNDTDVDIPREEFAPYKWRHGNPGIWGFDHPFKLYNARQILTLLTIARLIREVGTKIEQDPPKQISDAFSYSEAVTTYLSMALCKYSDFNSMASRWNPGWLKFEDSLSVRGIAMMWSWVDSNPGAPFTGTWDRSIQGIIGGLGYILEARGIIKKNGSKMTESKKRSSTIKTILDDATSLSKIEPDTKFDLIVTDPPYYDDVMYTELSDLYYVWLKRSLSMRVGNRLVPRYYREAFFKKVGNEFIEKSTQWEEFATREVSLHPPRLGADSTFEEGRVHFQTLLDASFLTMKSVLKDQGYLVTYYAHTDPEAWKALLRSGWESARLSVSNAFPIITEFDLSIVKRGTLSLDTSIVVIWRSGAKGTIAASKLYDKMIVESTTRIESAIQMKIRGSDLFVGALAAALSEATKYNEIIEMKKLETSELMDKYILRAALYGLGKAISQKAHVEEGIRSNEGLLYLVTKFLYAGSSKKVVTSDDARIFSLGAGIDLSHVVNDLKMFRAGREDEEVEGSSLAKRKMLVLLEPQEKDKSKLREFLYSRGIDIEYPIVRSSIDALHLLEYYTLADTREKFKQDVEAIKAKYPSETEEAIGLAKVISGSFEDDTEGELCTNVIKHNQGFGTDLRDYSGGL